MSQTNSNNPQPGKPMDAQAASRIQSATAKANNGQVAKDSFPARSQAAAARNEGQNGGGGKK